MEFDLTKISKKTITVYCCGVDWQHELGEASGGNRVYGSVLDLKKYDSCWEQCGIVELEIRGVKWVEPQDIYKKLSSDYVSKSSKPNKT